MSGSTFRLRRGTTLVALAVGGAAVAVATWVGGSPAWALGMAVAYLVVAALTYLWAGRAGGAAAVLRAEPDERQRGLDRDATALTGVAMALAGAIVSIGRSGNPGAYGVMCVVGGSAYAISLAMLRPALTRGGVARETPISPSP